MLDAAYHVKDIDDIAIWRSPAGRIRLPYTDKPRHQLHRVYVVLPPDGDTPAFNPHVFDTTLLSSNAKVMSLAGKEKLPGEMYSDSLLIDFPSYRLDLCPFLVWHCYRFGDERSYLIHAMLNEIDGTLLQQDSMSQRYLAIAITELLQVPFDTLASQPEDEASRMLIAIAGEVRRKIDDPHLRADDVASALDISRAHIYRLLSPYGGFKTCLQAQRLDRMARMLRNPEKDNVSIKGMLFHNGFNTTEQFQRLFRQRFGASAREFRRQGCPLAPS